MEDGLHGFLKGIVFCFRAGLVNALAGSDRYFMGVANVNARIRRVANGNVHQDVYFFMVRGSVCGLIFGCFLEVFRGPFNFLRVFAFQGFVFRDVVFICHFTVAVRLFVFCAVRYRLVFNARGRGEWVLAVVDVEVVFWDVLYYSCAERVIITRVVARVVVWPH